MQITYNTFTLLLEDMPLDVGYATERVTLINAADKSTFLIGGQTGSTQLILTTPFIDNELLMQLDEIDTLLELNALQGISKSIVFATEKETLPERTQWQIGIDKDEAFGDYYGIRLADGELGKEFAKSLMIISKDGALFYNEILKNLNETFTLEKAIPKIAAAQSCYTGKGCH